MAPRPRPLSPHLQVYRPMYTTVLSITHRATGLVLAAGLLCLLWWLLALAAGPEAYANVYAAMTSPPGELVVAGLVVAFWYHFCNGLRHLNWDAGRGLEKVNARRSGTLVVVATLILATLTLLAMLRTGGRL
ncbi:MAG TPA: succinate dehydrogenase, cytochrome b556 subunit [Steroidobacteraceae bacterium]|nr:succinate dehydrogenase, cytochrome b556 subunit [Steroidobacteraceae bacterium]